MTRKTNEAGIELIKAFEGLSLTPYYDVAGYPTVGYGHAINVDMSQTITEQQAEDLLVDDLGHAERAVVRACKVPLTDNQFAALVSLCFNCGPKPLYLTLGSKLAGKDYEGAANEFLRWNKAGGKVVNGLTRRREAERTLFLKP